jgi:hypothetical protein
VGALGLVVGSATIAGAQEADTYGQGRTAITQPAVEPQAVPSAISTDDRAPEAGNATLPFTGGDLIGLGVVGVAAVATGVVATRLRRARPSPQ